MHFEILPAMGEDREVKRKVEGRRKQLLPLPNLVFPLKALISTLYMSVTGDIFFSSVLQNDGQKSLILLYSFTHLPSPCHFCWEAEAASFAGLRNSVQRQLSLLAFGFNAHLKPSELLESITKSPLNFPQNQDLNFKNTYLHLKDAHSNFWLHGHMIWQTIHT